MSIERDLFRAVLGSFPTGVTVVTTVDGSGTPRGLTSNAVCAVSAEPPLLLICVDKRSTCLSALLETKAFVVNFLAAGRGELATRFAARHVDRFSEVRWQPAAMAGGAPVLAEDIVAHAECALVQSVEAGDHFVLIGHIEAGSCNGGSPLMYLRRMYAGWPNLEPAPRGEDIHG